MIAIEFSRPLGAGVNVSRFLVLEATGRQANLIMLDDKQKIIEVAKHVHPKSTGTGRFFPDYFILPTAF